MKRQMMKIMVVFAAGLLFLSALCYAQPPEPAKTGPAPIAQQFVREGSLAVKLVSVLGLSPTSDETQAETTLGEVGITPRNGWIADYPVTPDIVGELQAAIGEAADANKLTVGRDEAQKRFEGALDDLKLDVKPYTGTSTYEILPEKAENYPNPAVINNYYTTEGPPVVTYYSPPPDYYYLYSWVPYPFWWFGFWYPGYFVLHDFHRPVFVDRRVVFVSNHFNDLHSHRVFRVDPVARFRGRTFAGIGVSHNRRDFISTGVPRSDRRIFNEPRTRMTPEGRTMVHRTQSGGRVIAPPAQGGGRSIIPAQRGTVRSAPPTIRSGAGQRGGSRGGAIHGGGGSGGPASRSGGAVRSGGGRH
ncbi:MAG TPA: hypothetical protein VIU41_10300 [Geobacteraceae bacterium]